MTPDPHRIALHEVTRRTLTPRQAVLGHIDYCVELYEHLRGPGHKHTEREAVETVLRDMAKWACNWIRPKDGDEE